MNVSGELIDTTEHRVVFEDKPVSNVESSQKHPHTLSCHLSQSAYIFSLGFLSHPLILIRRFHPSHDWIIEHPLLSSTPSLSISLLFSSLHSLSLCPTDYLSSFVRWPVEVENEKRRRRNEARESLALGLNAKSRERASKRIGDGWLWLRLCFPDEVTKVSSADSILVGAPGRANAIRAPFNAVR